MLIIRHEVRSTRFRIGWSQFGGLAYVVIFMFVVLSNTVPGEWVVAFDSPSWLLALRRVEVPLSE